MNTFELIEQLSKKSKEEIKYVGDDEAKKLSWYERNKKKIK